jgi:hypothetical protein
MQAPPHARSQHTPSAQKFELHSEALAQAWPGPFLPQLPFAPGFMQMLLVPQSALDAHRDLHAVPAHA